MQWRFKYCNSTDDSWQAINCLRAASRHWIWQTWCFFKKDIVSKLQWKRLANRSRVINGISAICLDLKTHVFQHIFALNNFADLHYFEGTSVKWQTHLDWKIASVHVVPQEKVASRLGRPSDFEEFHEIVKLTVDVTTDWTCTYEAEMKVRHTSVLCALLRRTRGEYYNIKSNGEMNKQHGPVIGASTSKTFLSFRSIAVPSRIIFRATSSSTRPSWKKWAFKTSWFGFPLSSKASAIVSLCIGGLGTSARRNIYKKND